MIKNYLKAAWRSVLHHKTTSLISIVGLALGVTCFLLLATYLINELRYDRFHQFADRIVRTDMNYKAAGDAVTNSTALTPTAPVPVFKQEITEIEDGVRIYDYSGSGPASVKYKDKLFNETPMLVADEAFFKIFSFKFLAGNPATALANPQSVVITAAVAKKYFGDENPISKVLTVKGIRDMMVTGVIENIPAYSQIKFDLMGTYSMLDRSKTREWSSANDYSYLLLKPGVDYHQVERKMNAYVKGLFKNEQAEGGKNWYTLEPLTSIHLHSKVGDALEIAGNSTQVYILGMIACILLLMACINFLNLVTARSVDRAREIGVRKVMGAVKGQLFTQFMMEAALITAISIILGVATAGLSFGWFSNFAMRQIGFSTWNIAWLVVLLFGLLVLVTFLAGIYPALYMSAFKPITALSSKPRQGNTKGVSLRKSLVVVQFLVSVFFIVSTLIAGRQLQYIQQVDTGINRSHVVVINTGGMNYNDLEAFNGQVVQQPGVVQSTASYDSPVNVGGGYSITGATGKPANYALSVTAIPVERNFVPTLGLRLIAGANFTYGDEQQVRSQTNQNEPVYAFIINESAAKAMGWHPPEAIGKIIALSNRRGEVRGVTKDFNFSSLHQAIKPIVIFPDYNWFGKILIKVSDKNISQTIAGIQKRWKAFYPNKPFEFHFLDQEFDEMYSNEQQVGSILTMFTVITIFISCLGLFGLAVYMVKQRVKEIGIRKTLGASVSNILTLIAADFLKLVFIAILLASPIAWFVMNKWLQDFAYRVHVSAWLFAQAAVLTIAITLLTIGFQSIKAAIANPVKSLRSE
ncbi:FtsX-like permease family protein [Mucilaginibacter robiniae]|uniref:FtsX-like permease family protein n=1 Tax=Mucilaginibacter robiniae TaxID=2728022 RepID=A0A7L5E4E4_9SPHI|nr:ABC transporter permease [Mucilaginibacter robiniae]QJD98182.1 FtsX-like permease family protein [Mucilaginibacter robiniae]